MVSSGQGLLYVVPENFNDIYNVLKAPLQPSGFRFRIQAWIFIGGASGVGKTRIALELANKLRSDVQANIVQGVEEVQFLSLPMRSYDGDWLNTSHYDITDHNVLQQNMEHNHLVLIDRLVMSNYTGISRHIQINRSLTLLDVVSTMFSPSSSSKLKVLVLNLDECQQNPFAALQIIRLVLSLNESPEEFKVLPVLTGLYISEQEIQRALPVSRWSSKYIFLHFLPENNIEVLVKDVCLKCLPADAALVKGCLARLQSAEARMLMEDTLGYARAAVILGSTVASAAIHDVNFIFRDVERDYTAKLEALLPASKFISGHAVINKLVHIAVSPHPVRQLLLFSFILTLFFASDATGVFT